MKADQRRIAHLDMDAFYASVELLKYPELRGNAVVIGGGTAHRPIDLPDGTRSYSRLKDYVGRGVVTTSTYEARALGIYSAMGIMKVAHLAPNAILLPSDFDSYRYYSRQFKTAVRAIAPLVEDRGIDEIYIDLTDHSEETQFLAQRIKDAVHDATGLSCSIGVAPNKLLAKICSDLEKPDGLTLLRYSDIPDRIWPLPARKINGIGPKASTKLETLGILTVGDLANADPDILQMNFGRNYAAWLLNAAHGLDERPISTSTESKSISRETTFERDLHARRDRELLSTIFTDLCERLAGDLSRKGLVTRKIGIKLRFSDFQILSRDITLSNPTAEAAAIRKAAGECLRRAPLDKKLRLLGVRASALAKLSDFTFSVGQIQGDLFLSDER